MIRFLNRLIKAPLNYLAKLRKLTFKRYLLIHTNFSPSYPVMIFSALTFTLLFSILILYYVFTNPLDNSCLHDFRGAAYILAILYPLQTILCFICITGTIALSKSNCWKIIWIIYFGPVLSGFGFGEIGFAMVCVLQSQSEVFSMPSALVSAGFIDAIAYLYITFLILYFILVPSINFLYRKMDQDSEAANANRAESPDDWEDEPQKGCCSKFLTVLYYALNAIFAAAVVFIILIKLVGPVMFTYLWIEIGANLGSFPQPRERFLFATMLLCYFGPLGMMFVALGIQRIVKLGRDKKDSDKKQGEEEKDVSQMSSRRSSTSGRDVPEPREMKFDQIAPNKPSEKLQTLEDRRTSFRSSLRMSNSGRSTNKPIRRQPLL